MDLPDLSDHLEQMRAQNDRLRAMAAKAAPLRIRYELQRTTDEPLRRLLQRAERGELTLLEMLGSPDYQRVHGQAYEDAAREYERARDAGELPDPAEIEGDVVTALGEGVDQLQAEVERAEAAQRADPGGDPTDAARGSSGEEPAEFVYRPKITDR